MTTYLVTRRMQEDRVYLPGETITNDPPWASILVARGYLSIVPDNYKAPGSKSKTKKEADAEAEAAKKAEDEAAAAAAEAEAEAAAKTKAESEASTETSGTDTEPTERDPEEVAALAKAMAVTEKEVLALEDKDYAEATNLFLNESSTGNDLSKPETTKKTSKA